MQGSFNMKGSIVWGLSENNGTLLTPCIKSKSEIPQFGSSTIGKKVSFFSYSREPRVLEEKKHPYLSVSSWRYLFNLTKFEGVNS